MKETNLKLLSSSSGCSDNKREQRLERKKRKILALAELMQLNEQDRSISAAPDTGLSPADATSLVSSAVENGCPLEKEHDSKKVKLKDEEYRLIKAEINQQRDRMRNIPKIRLKEVGEEALFTTKPEDRVPLLLDDIQALLMYTLLRTDSPTNPSRWAALQKSTKLTHTNVLLIEGLTSDDFVEFEADFKECKRIFRNILQVVVPSHRLVDELACVPLSDTHKDILLAEYGSLEAAMLARKDNLLIKKSIFTNIDFVEDGSAGNYDVKDLPPTDKFPRTQLLLSPIQMINEDYPLPLTGSLKQRYAGYVTTNDHYAPVTPKSPMFGLDCEMCKTSIGASELTRVSFIDEDGKEFYESLVRPANRIVDYLTQFSGITAEMMKNVSKTLQDVQKDLRNKLPPDAILVGQSLNFDLHALKMMHPYVVDTSILYNLTGTAGTKSKLKILSQKFLKRDIQCSSGGHNSIEDCTASLELVKLKLSKNIYFGDQWLQDRRNYYKKMSSKVGIATPEELKSLGGNSGTSEITATLFGHAKKRNKKSTIVTNGDHLDNFGNYFGEAIQANKDVKKLLSFQKLDSDQEVIKHTVEQCLNYDFNLSCIQLKDEHLTSAETKREKIVQIDEWIRQLYGSISVNGLLVVLLAGGEVNDRSKMAVAMIQTRKG